MRYVLEGEWSGYRSSQRKVCRRRVLKKLKGFDHLTTIRFTDGTTLDLKIRPCKPRERIDEIHGYDQLVDEARFKNKSYVTVEELNK